MLLVNHFGFMGLGYETKSLPVACNVGLVVLVPLFVFRSPITSIINILTIGEFNVEIKEKFTMMLVHSFVAGRDQLYSRMDLLRPVFKINFRKKGGIKISRIMNVRK